MKPSNRIGSSNPLDDRSWSTITWSGNGPLLVLLVLALICVATAVTQ